MADNIISLHCVKMKQMRPNPQITETDQQLITDGPVRFIVQVRKELYQKHDAQSQSKGSDAFEVISADYVVFDAEIPGYQLIFNKFNVARYHYLLVAYKFTHQLELLYERDFEAISRIHSITGLRCFYNGGRRSGSSQPRRHMQFVDVEAPMDEYVRDLRMEPGTCCSLPLFGRAASGVIMLHGWNAKELYSAYVQLLEHCRVAISEPVFVSDLPTDYPDRPYFPYMRDIYQHLEDGMCYIALDGYSLMIGPSYMLMCQRSAEGFYNSIALSGSLFFKNQSARDQVIAHGIVASMVECMSVL